MMRPVVFSLLLAFAGAVAWAEAFTAVPLVQTPPAGPADLALPRALLADPVTQRCYVLDSKLARVLAFTPQGTPTATWDLTKTRWEALGVIPADPLLPIPALAAAGKTIYLIGVQREERQVTLIALDGPGETRTIALPKGATYGAVTVDAAGRLLVAYLQVANNACSLLLGRETAAGEVDTLATLNDPCGGQLGKLNLTGFTVAPDGRLAIGLAQTGDAAYSFVRSWLVQGTLKSGALTGELHTTHHNSLLDGRGKLLDRFRAAVELAGSEGYPAKPCVPIFTSLAFGDNGEIISGGHSTDPFLRRYAQDGGLLLSLPHQGIGGQHVAVLPVGKELRLYAADAAGGRVHAYTPDGRTLGGFGTPFAYDLREIQTLAANTRGVYALTREWGDYRLLRFTPTGELCWTRPVNPPTGMEKATPYVVAPGLDCVLIGWRQPATAGIGWVEMVMADGTPGLPLWDKPITHTGGFTGRPEPTPMVTGQNGSVYILAETVDGTRLQSFSPTGTRLLQFPEMQGITAVAMDGTLAWARRQGDELVLALFTPQGKFRGTKRIPRPSTDDAQLWPVHAQGQWGWFTATGSLLKLDETLTVTDEATIVMGEDETPVSRPLAIAGDGQRRIYLALRDGLYVVEQ